MEGSNPLIADDVPTLEERLQNERPLKNSELIRYIEGKKEFDAVENKRFTLKAVKHLRTVKPENILTDY